MRKHFGYIFIATVLLAVSCAKEDNKTDWDVELLVPLAKTTMNFQKFVPDSLLSENEDNSLVIVYDAPVYELALDSVYKIPDTILVNNFNLPGSITVPPGSQILNLQKEIKLQTNEAVIRRLIVRSGFAKLVVRSTAETNLICKYTVPKATKNGVPFSITEVLPAATNNGISEIVKYYDMSGYTFDLTGASGNQINSLNTITQIQTDPNGPSVYFDNSDILQINNGFTDIVVEYALGTLGSKEILIGPATKEFSFFKKIKDGTISLEKVKAVFSIENNFGIDVNAVIRNFTSINSQKGTSVAMNDPLIGRDINLTRASDHQGNVIPSQYSFEIGNQAAKELLENFPDKIGYDIKVKTNPLGNVSGGNDFIYYGKGLKIGLDLEIPLSASVEKLTLVDTVDFTFKRDRSLANIQAAEFYIIADNGFPLSAKVFVHLLDSTNKPITTLLGKDIIEAAPVGSDNKVVAKKRSYLNVNSEYNILDLITGARKAVINVVFNSIPQNQYLKMYSHYDLDVKLTGRFLYLIKQ